MNPSILATLPAVLLAVLLAGCTSSPRAFTPMPGSASFPSFQGKAPPPGAPALGARDELWVIARSSAPRPHGAGPAREALEPPGTGALVVTGDAPDQIVPLPLRHTAVQARVAGAVATVEVRQTFHNPFSGRIEARYVFPLPEDAAVSEFVMTLGERRIRGVIRERSEAEQVYAEAKRQGYVASLLTQERPNLFTQSVANLDPGRSIDVSITYFNTLPYRDGWYEFVFPMVVGPRYNPPATTHGIGAVARTAPGSSGQPTEVSYLRPGERSGHDIALTLEVSAGVAIEAFESTSHVIETARPAPDRLRVELGALDRIPNRDFVLRYRVAGERLKSGFLAHRDERGGFFHLTLYPPAELAQLRQHPLELVFVLDCSGSMNGEPIAQAKAALRRALRQLRPEDAFQIVRFSSDSSQLGPRPLPATPEHVARGLAYLETLRGEGGTEMIQGIKAALDFPHDPGRLRFVVFLTDGYIGNEAFILAEVQQRLGAARIFSFGVGSAPNRYLLEGLARLGRGVVAYLGLQDDAVRVMDDFTTRVRHPALMDLTLDWGGLRVRDVYPARWPDLFVGRPLTVIGRFDGNASTPVTIRGQAGGRPLELTVPVQPPPGAAPEHAGLAHVWARRHLEALSDRQLASDDPTLAAQIRQTALDFGLLSAYTAFVAVDSLQPLEPAPLTTVAQPVPVPEGVSYDQTVPEPTPGSDVQPPPDVPTPPEERGR